MLYAGDLEYLVKRLKILISTAAARVVSGRSRFCPIRLTGYDRIVLHWLPAAQRTTFYVAILAFKVLNGLSPSYIINLADPSVLTSRRPFHRSSFEFRMVIPLHNKCHSFVRHLNLGWSFLRIAKSILNAHLWWPVS